MYGTPQPNFFFTKMILKWISNTTLKSVALFWSYVTLFFKMKPEITYKSLRFGHVMWAHFPAQHLIYCERSLGSKCSIYHLVHSSGFTLMYIASGRSCPPSSPDSSISGQVIVGSLLAGIIISPWGGWKK